MRRIGLLIGTLVLVGTFVSADDAPVISWYEKPANETCVTSPILFRAQATDDVGISSVYMKYTDAPSDLDFELEQNNIYRLDFQQRLNGLIDFEIVAIDINRNRSALPNPSVTLYLDHSGPQVNIQYPPEGYISTGAFRVQVSATESGCSAVESIEISYPEGATGFVKTVVVNGSHASQIIDGRQLAPGENLFSVRAKDALGNVSAWTTRTFMVMTDRPPLVHLDFEPQVSERSVVRIDASGSSDPDGKPLAYVWRQLWGPSVSVGNLKSSRLEFTAPYANPGYDRFLKFLLTVSDGVLTRDQEVEIQVVDAGIPNQAPVAVISGSTTISASEFGYLNGSASYDPEGDPLSFGWAWTSDVSVVLNDAFVSNPLFKVIDSPTPNQIQFFLTVKDQFGAQPDSQAVFQTQINPSPNIVRPEVRIKPFSVASEGAQMRLEVENPRADLYYEWSQISGPHVSIIGQTSAQIELSLPYVFQPTVLKFMVVATTDEGVASFPTVATLPVNDSIFRDHEPVAVGQVVGTPYVGQEITLSAAGSYDPEQSPLTYEWTQIEGPGVHLYGAHDPQPRFYTSISAQPINYRFQLKVKDSAGQLSAPSQVNVVALSTQSVPDYSFDPVDGSVSGPVTLQVFVGSLNNALPIEHKLYFERDQAFSLVYAIDPRTIVSIPADVSFVWDSRKEPNGFLRAVLRTCFIDGRIFETNRGYEIENDAKFIPKISLQSPLGDVIKGLQEIRFALEGDINQVDVFINNIKVPYSVSGNVYSVLVNTRLYSRELKLRIDAYGLIGSKTFEKSFIVDNVLPSSVVVIQPQVGQELFGLYPFVVDATDNDAISRVEFIVDSTVLSEIREGVNSRYSYSLDTRNSGLPDGYHVFVARAFDRAGNQRSSSPVYFFINNSNLPTSNVTVTHVHPALGAVTSTEEESSIFFILSGDPDPDSVADGIRVRQINTPNRVPVRIPGDVLYSNRIVTFSGTIPRNAEIEWDINIKDPGGHVISGVYRFYRTMPQMTGGDVSLNRNGSIVKVSVPPGALPEDAYLLIEPLDISSMPGVEPNSDVDVNVLSLFRIYALRAGSSEPITDLNLPVSLLFSETVPPSAPEEQARVIQIQDYDGNSWSGLKALSQGEASVSNSATLRQMSVTLSKLSTFRVVSFSVPSNGISQLFNYPNPFNPTREVTSFQYVLGEKSDVTLSIYDIFGNLVKKITYAQGSQGGLAGINTVEWDGRNGEQQLVSNGGYVAYLKASVGGTVVRRKVAVVK